MSTARTALLLAPVALFARGAGFLVPIAIAGWYGVGDLPDAFFYALGVPSFVLVLAGNAMGTALVPVLADLRVRDPAREGQVATGAMVLSTLAAAAIACLAAATLPAVLRHASDFTEPTAALAETFAWQLVPFVAAIGGGAVARSACEVHGAFVAAGLGPLVRAAALLATIAGLRSAGPVALPAGMAAGALAEGAWLLVHARRAGCRLVLPSPALPRELRAALAVLLPVLLGEAMVALNLVVDKAFAATLAPGAVSVLEYADRARMIPQTFLESTLLVVAFNEWARARAEGRDRQAAIARALRWAWLLAPPVLGGMFLGRHALVRLLFERGAFLPEHSAPCAEALGAFVPGLFASILGALVMRAHVVEGRYGLVARLGVASLLLNAALDAALVRLGLVGLGLATSITTIAITAISARALGVGVPRDGLLVLAAASAMALAPVHVDSIADPVLWLAAVPFLALFAVGLHRARRDAA